MQTHEDKTAPLNHARKFVEKFGFNHISVDDFDTFIIDRGMVEDPETDDTKDPRFRLFVAKRANAKNRLNNVGELLDNGDRFKIVVDQPGVSYRIDPYSGATLEKAGQIGERVRDYAEKRHTEIKRDIGKVRRALSLDPDDEELRETLAMLQLVDTEALLLDGKVRAITNHFQLGYDAAKQRLEAHRDLDLLLEDDS